MVGVIAISDLIELKLVELSFERKCSIIETISLQQHTSQRQKARLYGGRIIGRCSGNRRGKEISKHTSYVSQWVSLSLSPLIDRVRMCIFLKLMSERRRMNRPGRKYRLRRNSKAGGYQFVCQQPRLIHRSFSVFNTWVRQLLKIETNFLN